MNRYAAGITLSLSAVLLGCSDGSDRSTAVEPPAPPPPPPPVTELAEQGTYTGTLETSTGDVALMSLLLATDGTTAIALDTDDDERNDIVLWGESTGENGDISFGGRGGRNGDEVSVDLVVEQGQASGQLQLQGLAGEFTLAMAPYSDRPGGIADVAGHYTRLDNITGQTQLDISTSGEANLSGSCSASGEVTEINTAANLVRLQLSSDCLELDALISRQDTAAEDDTLQITGFDQGSSYSTTLYRTAAE